MSSRYLTPALTVVFSSSDKIDDHLFYKAIRWAEQNPDDLVFWARRKPLTRIPTTTYDFSSIISILRRVNFGYNPQELYKAIVAETFREEVHDDVAAIICSVDPTISTRELAAILAALANFCKCNNARATVSVDCREEILKGEGEENARDEQQLETLDSFENPVFLPNETKKDEQEEKKEKKKKVVTEEDIDKLQLICSMYTHMILTYDGEKFVNLTE